MTYVLKMNGNKKASYQYYIEENKDVDGWNWDKINKDRIQCGLKPLPYTTKYINEPTV